MQVQLCSSVLLGIATSEGQGVRQLKDNFTGRRKRSVMQQKAQSIPQVHKGGVSSETVTLGFQKLVMTESLAFHLS